MLKRIAIASLLALGTAQAPASAQDYPTQPIRIVVPFSPGGGNDLLGRIAAEYLTTKMGQTVFVENKPGAGSSIGIDIVAKAKPDGYTILWTPSDGTTMLPAVKTNVPYKMPDDFSYVARITQLPLIVTVASNLPIKTMKDLIEYGKANPGKLRYGTAGVAGGPHLTTELLNKTVGITGVHVPYPGVGPSLAALAGGHIDLGLAAPSSVKQHIDSGLIRALATTGTKRHPLYPDVPTLREAGVPLDVTIFYGILAPASVPEPILVRLRKEFNDMLKDPKIVERFDKLGYQPDYIEGDEFKKFVVKDLETWREVARTANIKIPD